MQQDHHVSVLLDGARFTKVGEHRLLVRALFRTTIQLTHRDNWYIEFLGQKLYLAGEFGHFLLTRFDFLTGSHQLQVVDDD